MKKLLIILAAFVGLQACGYTDTSIKVISYNIRQSAADDGENGWELRKGATLEMLERESPDLVGMQEVLPDQYDYLDEKAAGYGIVGVGRDDGVRRGEMMAVLYKKERFDKLEEGHFWLSETPDEVSRGWDGACNRMVTWLRLMDKAAGREIYFFNTHFDHQGRVARDEGARLTAIKIIELTKNAPFVLTGDFNARPENPVLDELRVNFDDARANATATDGRATFNGFGEARADETIDHIYSGGFRAEVFRVLDGDYGAPYISDHYPVEAVFVYAE